MIDYSPFWDTMNQKKITKYQLIFHWGISSNTLRRMSHNQPINTNTINQLCLILDCQVSDILKFSYTAEETEMIEKQRTEIKNKKAKK